jgi:hypothetical protein
MILYGYLILFLSVLYMLTAEFVRKLNQNIFHLERGNFVTFIVSVNTLL